MRHLPLLATAALLLLAVPAAAADRSYPVGSFERVRVDGPFAVRIVDGSPGARASGDKALIERVQVAVNGTTLVVRLASGDWNLRPIRRDAKPPVVTLSTPRLSAVIVNAGAQVEADRAGGQRVDLSIAGAGAVKVGTIDTAQLVVTVVGPGAVTVGGRAQRARLTVNGPGTIDGGLTASELFARVDGTGEIRTAARYTAQVTTTGLGKVTVLGGAKCEVRAIAGGPVQCGAGPLGPAR